MCELSFHCLLVPALVGWGIGFGSREEKVEQYSFFHFMVSNEDGVGRFLQ
jgi:hypothetical protein